MLWTMYPAFGKLHNQANLHWNSNRITIYMLVLHTSQSNHDLLFQVLTRYILTCSMQSQNLAVLGVLSGINSTISDELAL